MKRIIVLLTVVLLFVGLGAIPQKPSARFYGNVIGGKVGQVISVFIQTKYVATTKVIVARNGQATYSVIVPVDKADEGKPVSFIVDHRLVGSGIVHSGGNQHVDLHIVKAYIKKVCTNICTQPIP